MLGSESIDQQLPNIDTFQPVKRYSWKIYVVLVMKAEIFNINLFSSSLLCEFQVDHKNKIATFGQQRRVCAPLYNEEKPSVNIPNQRKTVAPTLAEKSDKESIEYEAMSRYGSEQSHSGKRSLGGNNRTAKKHCSDISITDLFGDRR